MQVDCKRFFLGAVDVLDDPRGLLPNRAVVNASSRGSFLAIFWVSRQLSFGAHDSAPLALGPTEVTGELSC